MRTFGSPRVSVVPSTCVGSSLGFAGAKSCEAGWIPSSSKSGLFSGEGGSEDPLESADIILASSGEAGGICDCRRPLGLTGTCCWPGRRWEREELREWEGEDCLEEAPEGGWLPGMLHYLCLRPRVFVRRSARALEIIDGTVYFLPTTR